MNESAQSGNIVEGLPATDTGMYVATPHTILNIVHTTNEDVIPNPERYVSNIFTCLYK